MSSNNFAMMARVRGEISVEQLREALRQIPIRHPGIVTVREGSDDPIGPEFPITTHTDARETDWVEVVQKELDHSFTRERPYARFIFLQHAGGGSFDLVGVFHHHVCEGMSGMFIMRDLLQVLGSPGYQLAPLAMPGRMDSLIPKALLENAAFQANVKKAFRDLRWGLFVEKLRRRIFGHKDSTPVEDEQLVHQFVLLPTQWTVVQTAALAERCKAEGVSVHAALCVAWIQAFVDQANGEKPKGGTVSSPVSLRNRLSSPIEDTAGQFLSIVHTHIDCPPGKDFWEMARDFKQKFADGTTDEGLFFRPVLFGSIFEKLPQTDARIVMSMIFSGRINYEFSVTNLGRVPIPEQNGSLQVEAFYGPLVNSAPRERTVGVSTQGGRMTICFLFRKSKMTLEQGQQMMNRALNILAQATQ